MIELIEPLPLIAEVDINGFQDVTCKVGKIVVVRSNCDEGTSED